MSDFNGDGVPDLAVATSNVSAIDLLQGNGEGTFRLVLSYTTSSLQGLVVADFNGDGRTDFWLLNPTGSEWFSAINVTQTTPSDPTAVETIGGVPGGATFARASTRAASGLVTGRVLVCNSPGRCLTRVFRVDAVNSARAVVAHSISALLRIAIRYIVPP